jgi:2-(1,2-epoxy-1,2-dihydrophenyl)acetyl-CoA isomerase
VSEAVTVEVRDDHVAVVEFSRPPHNHFDAELIGGIADAYDRIDEDPAARAIVLCSAGKHFCAGADFGGGDNPAGRSLYDEAYRLVAGETPVVAAVQGAAVGGGLGVAMTADFRVATPESRFVANFSRLGIHHGFGLTVTLPAVVGPQRALEVLYVGERIKGEDAYAMGLCDRLVASETLRDEAIALAARIAEAAPLALRSIRRTMRSDVVERFRDATIHEQTEQEALFGTEDFGEGVKAASQRRTPRFEGR